VDCDLKEFWAVINEKIWGYSECRLKFVTKSWTQYTFFSKCKPQLATASGQRPTVVLAQLHASVSSTTLADVGCMVKWRSLRTRNGGIRLQVQAFIVSHLCQCRRVNNILTKY